ncbi:hypothetical protein [Brevibacterium zhoupengii]|uniref:hypothetical protein n=1 Tax=Brevibacterium zhoupengii TaxID=2898795 RepID=UPI001F08B60A|nr:hypothetical protein [Brevibacterium zhoupengii]
MNTTTKLSGGFAALAIAGLALSGCSMFGGEKESESEQPSKPKQLTIDGVFVFAPAAGDDSGDETPAPTTGDAPNVGDLFTMTIDGSKVTVSRGSCTTDAEGVPTQTTDARQTSFGELGEASSKTAAPISWLEAGAFAEDDQSELAVLSDGNMVKVGKKSFFAADGTQGKALVDQFHGACSAPEGDEGTETAEPTDPSPGDSGEGSQPSTAPAAGGEQ